MNDLHLKKIALALLGCAGMTLSAFAGDKIVLSDEKPQAEPNAPTKAANDLFNSKSWKMNDSGLSLDPLLGIPTIPRATPLSPQEMRKRKAANEDRNNWLLAEPGERERKEEERQSLGVSNKPLEDLNGGEKSDYLLSNSEGKNGPQRRQPGELRPIGKAPTKQEIAEARQIQQQQREREDAEAADNKKVFSLNGGSGDSQVGAHTSSELNFNNLFSPGKNDALIAGSAIKSESGFSLKDALQGSPARTKEQQARMDDFNKMMSAPLTANGFLGMANPPGSTALGLPSGAFPRPEEPRATPNPGFDPASSAGPLNRFSAPGLPSFNNAPPMGGSPGSSPFEI